MATQEEFERLLEQLSDVGRRMLRDTMHKQGLSNEDLVRKGLPAERNFSSVVEPSQAERLARLAEYYEEGRKVLAKSRISHTEDLERQLKEAQQRIACEVHERAAMREQFEFRLKEAHAELARAHVELAGARSRIEKLSVAPISPEQARKVLGIENTFAEIEGGIQDAAQSALVHKLAMQRKQHQDDLARLVARIARVHRKRRDDVARLEKLVKRKDRAKRLANARADEWRNVVRRMTDVFGHVTGA